MLLTRDHVMFFGQVLLLGEEKNPGISYEYSVPTSVTTLPERTQFSWRTGEFDKCSASCAGGKYL